MAMTTITPVEAKAMKDSGAVIIDIREPDEYAREHIVGARNAPISKLNGAPVHQQGDVVIYHCKSGMRTEANAHLLPTESCEAYVLEGGLEAWKSAGLKVETDRSKPIEIMRQVQIAAGSLVIVGVALGAIVNPAFYALSAFVGAGLVFAGVSGFCGMAKVLGMMPWNRRASA